ncbi:DUF3696 domain-containing protein [Marinobacter sp. SBS5]|uniref:DUF3696 domain-containing protein n=1 Tax=Marinobacter sp. SBS5 TaxID=3401754 RepID=UPI003AAAA625
MRFNSLELEKFKRFEKAKIKFGDITILAGANSSGKSTILKALTTIVQSCEHKNFPFAIDLNGELCELGSYGDVCFGLKAQENVKIAAEINSNGDEFLASGKYRYASNGNLVLPQEITFKSPRHELDLKWEGKKVGYKARGRIRQNQEGSSKKYEEAMRYVFKSFFDVSSRLESFENNDPNRRIDAEEEGKKIEEIIKRMKGSSDWEEIKAKKPDDIIDELSIDPAYSTGLSELTKLNNDIRTHCNYVAPIRAHPQRQYYVNSFEPKADTLGDNSHQILQYWKSHRKDKFQKLNSAAKSLNLASEIGVKNIKGNLIENSVIPFGHKRLINIADVGFGLSQAIPMLVSDIQLPDNSCLLINQPEVHLHPSAQALLANYFVNNIDKRQYIIETHSEYIINRLRILCINGKINPERIKIYFFDNTNKDFIHEVKIEKDGSLSGAPEGFFKTYKEDSFEIAMSGFDDD